MTETQTANMAESKSATRDSPGLDIHAKASTQSLNLVETKEMIMLQLDPLSMLNLVSISELALATFNRHSTKLLNSTLATLGLDGNAGKIPIAILEASKTLLSDGYCVDRKRERVRLRIAGEKPQTDLEKFLEEFVRKGHWQFRDNVQQPLDSLRQLARIHEAVEILMNSHIWTCIRHVDDSKYTVVKERWFSKKEDLRRVLWAYQLHCTLFHRAGTAGQGEVLFPSTNSQMKYTKIVEKQETYVFMKRLVSIYRDLSSFLAMIYKEDWGEIFSDNFKYYTTFSQDLREGKPMSRYRFAHSGYSLHIVGPEFWSDQKVVHDTHCDFYQYINYQMSKGLPHLAKMYRLYLTTERSNYPVQKYWTDSFFTNAFSTHSCGSPALHTPMRSKGYLLEPLGEGEKGYQLSITVPSTHGNYVLRVSKPLFADEEFKPTHLGSLEHCGSRSGEVDRGEGNPKKGESSCGNSYRGRIYRGRFN